MKLPKQWKHWCKKHGFRTHGSEKYFRGCGWLYLKGHGYCWRVNCYGMFECGDSYTKFDRWALCEIVEKPLPKTEREFILAYESMLEWKIGE
jgi:hypothetical protein